MNNNILTYKDFVNEFLFFKKKKKEEANLKSKVDISDEDKKAIIDDLKKWLDKNTKQATEIIVTPTTKPSKNTQLISHFGGDPYFDQDEEWPISSDKKHRMFFICQIISNKFPNGIKMIQIYDNFAEEIIGGNRNKFYLIKTYKNLKSNPKFIKNDLENVDDLGTYVNGYPVTYASIKFKDFVDKPVYRTNPILKDYIKSLIKKYNIVDDSFIYNYILWENNYNKIQNITNKINGYPNTEQVEEKRNKNDSLVFQVSSVFDIHFDIRGDGGSLYVYMNNNKPYLIFEC